MLSVLRAAVALLWKLIDPTALLVDAKHPSQQISAPLDAGRSYRIRRVVASSAQAFCISVVELGASQPRVLSSDCSGPGALRVDFDARESTVQGGPGRAYQISVSAPDGVGSARVHVRGMIEIVEGGQE